MQLSTSLSKIGNISVNIQQGNITEYENLDAIILPTNPLLLREPGVSGEIFKKCGQEKLEKALKKLKEKEKAKRRQASGLDEQPVLFNKVKEKQLILDFSQFLVMKQQEEKEEEMTDIRFDVSYVDHIKSYNLQNEQQVKNLLFVIEPEKFNEYLMIQSIKNMYFYKLHFRVIKSYQLNYKKVAIPILCQFFDNFEPKVWAFQYKKAFIDVQEQLKLDYQLEIIVVCHNEDILYGFQKTFQSSEYVKATNIYITDVQDVEVLVNPVNQNNPYFGASGKIIEKAGHALEQDIREQITKGNRWVLSKSFKLQEQKIKYILTFIGPVQQRKTRAEKLQYFFQKILQICNEQLKVESICIPLLAIPQAIFEQKENQNFLLNRIALSLKDAILEFEKEKKKHKYIWISIQDDQLREFCVQLFQ
ncbi:unnamed protein product (macronuclear) [Paramecium tetraurelia]|uniref:Macro domain-containing protein n=1 Tax=Paramecium tetraurelia TaxID=5888 RepID=A0BU86_PARTE|nr:uncharacterized protein GSPATT00032335001 [Paramecium tetraurelia]CAK62103.1 unnamed protein product [Paramecium tetraurelia]|eukprot:XP_001429501.1 hypothetical protein (macronuclear) [Paramecium tetraurelia strain d4-2]